MTCEKSLKEIAIGRKSDENSKGHFLRLSYLSLWNVNENLKSTFCRFMLVICIYIQKILSKSVNVAMSYKRLKMVKAAAFHDFRSTKSTPFDAFRLFLHQSISMFSACNRRNISTERVIYIFYYRLRLKKSVKSDLFLRNSDRLQFLTIFFTRCPAN